MQNFKPTKAELVIWNIFLVAVGAALTGGAPALLEYLAGTNIDIALCLKLALAGALGAFVASIATSFKKDGSATQNLLQAALDLLSQVHEAVTTQVVATPPARVVEPQPIVFPQPVPMPAQPAQTTYVQPNPYQGTAPISPPATVTQLASPSAWQTDLHFGDTGIVPTIPKQ